MISNRDAAVIFRQDGVSRKGAERRQHLLFAVEILFPEMNASSSQMIFLPNLSSLTVGC